MSTPATINAKEFFELLREDLAAIEREFGRDTVSGVEAITEIGEYLRGGGGKRIRPALLLLSSKLFNYQGRGAVRLGAVVEIIHTATLVHDDIIDEAQTRRGRPAANTQWGNSKVRAGRRLALHAGFQGRGAGAQFPHSRHADRFDAADGRGRTAADGKAGQTASPSTSISI